ncbi:hypothetical protein ACI7BZ_07260 [Xanthobacter sp. AM11]|uniref:hypothetical protein n=1 Tax=Xanthobacter sp. AM11 TaxID=3380643 RepID=UPI0039BF7139
MLCFTRADLNNVLNFNDLRASEVTLCLNGRTIPARELSSRFISNIDVVLDRIDPAKLAAKICDQSNFTIEFERAYPFHEVFIGPCLELSLRHRHAYSPVLWAGREANLSLAGRHVASLPIYGVVFEGHADRIPRLELALIEGEAVELGELTIGALFVPNPDIQAEAIRREQLTFKAAAASGRGPSTPEAGSDWPIDFFERALKSLWPAEAMGRLATYVNLRENRADIRAFGVEISRKGVPIEGRLGELYEEVELTSNIVASKAPGASLPRSSEVDSLALRGVLSYRRGDWPTVAGWPLFVSSKDPAVMVRSNGVVRWLRLAHGDFESIERIKDQRNLALGARTAWDLYGHLAPDRRVLFAGLGLGVVQRANVLDSTSVTCEINEGVIDAFAYIYPDVAHRLEIQCVDFYDYVERVRGKQAFSMAFLDFYDPDDRFFRLDVLEGILRIAPLAVINRLIRDASDLNDCRGAIARLPFPVEEHFVEGKQLVIAIGDTSKNGRRTSAVSLSAP